MPTFTELNAGDFAALAAAFDLGAVIATDTIEAGTINSNFAVDTDAGRFFVRVNEGKAEPAVRYEAELVAVLAASGVATPVPLRAADGRRYAERNGKLVSVFPWVAGSHRTAGTITPADTAAVGRALAALHRAGLPISERFASESIYTTARIAERFEGFRGSTDPVLAGVVGTIADELSWLDERAGVRAAAVHGLIHGDLFADNVLFDGPDVAALIDFEQASSGSLVYDLAVCLNAWCYDGDFDAASITALIAGYEEVRPLSAADRAALGVEVRAAAVRFAVTRITDVYLPGLHTPGKDFRRYLARLDRWRDAGAALLSGVGGGGTPGVGSRE